MRGLGISSSREKLSSHCLLLLVSWVMKVFEGDVFFLGNV